MAEHPAVRVGRLLDGAWAASALASVLVGGVDRRLARDDPATALLLKAGLLEDVGDAYVVIGREVLRGSEPTLLALIRSSLGQAAAIATGRSGWQTHEDEVLSAQGEASAAGGKGMAAMVQMLPELKQVFDQGGVLLDVGVGVAALACAFCEAVPGARVIGLDVLPRALELARQRVRESGLEDRVDLRQVGIEQFDEEEVADIAHMSPVFIPPAVLPSALANLRRAVKPGGWLVLSGILDDGPDGATTRWMAHHAGGSPLTAADVSGLAAETGFAAPIAPPVPLPPGARVLMLRRE